MCGIAGFIAKDTWLASTLLEEMTQSLRHRGPDDEGYLGIDGGGSSFLWKRANEQSAPLKVGMGFRRLAILDLSPTGAQPMRSSDQRYWIAFNGEIYNYIELKEQLQVEFRSRSDTEVLLELFARDGLAALPKLNGIFAFSIYDVFERKLWVARDPFGIKPLYYFIDERGFFFASEIKALLRARATRPRLNASLVQRYLASNWIADPDTMFEGIRKLEPGHVLSVAADGTVNSRSYWDFVFHTQTNTTASEWLERLDSVLDRALDRQLRSDVPVAFFLSGGLDSSLLAAKAIKLRRDPPTTFTIGFKWGKKTDAASSSNLDLECARKLSAKFPFRYKEILLEPSIVSLLPKVVQTLEEPIADPAALCSYLICEAASRDFRVLISGQGGDELFGGYPVFQAGRMAHDLGGLPRSFLRILRVAAAALPYSIGRRRFQSVHRIKKLAFAALQKWPEPFLTLRSAFGGEDLSSLLSPDLRTHQAPQYLPQLSLFERAESWDILQQLMYLDIKTYLPCLNLTYTDKTSMAHSVEARVPFLDREMADLAVALPSSLKMSFRQSKILLKAYAEGVLPQEVIHRKKTGFGLPLKEWFLEELQPMAQDLLSESRLRRQGLFEPGPIKRYLKEHRERVADHSFKIYSLMTFQLWTEAFGI